MIEFERDFTHESRASVRANDDLSVLMTSPVLTGVPSSTLRCLQVC
jgi:hypothetical protein